MNAFQETIQKHETDIQSLRDQLRESKVAFDLPFKTDIFQERELELLQRNVELEESWRNVEEKMSQKEQQVMELGNKLTDIQEDHQRKIGEKEEAIEGLEKQVRKLKRSNDSTVESQVMSIFVILICTEKGIE